MLPHRGNVPPRVKKVIDLLLGEGELPFFIQGHYGGG
jgi:hypothetical protein